MSLPCPGLATAGNEKALTQVEAFDVLNLKLHGSLAFLLWKSVYITKQVGKDAMQVRKRLLHCRAPLLLNSIHGPQGPLASFPAPSLLLRRCRSVTVCSFFSTG